MCPSDRGRFHAFAAKKRPTTGFVMLCRFARVITILMSVTTWAVNHAVIAKKFVPRRPRHSSSVFFASCGTHPNTSLLMAVKTSPAMIGRDMTIKMIFGLICHRFE